MVTVSMIWQETCENGVTIYTIMNPTPWMPARGYVSTLQVLTDHWILMNPMCPNVLCGVGLICATIATIADTVFQDGCAPARIPALVIPDFDV